MNQYMPEWIAALHGHARIWGPPQGGVVGCTCSGWTWDFPDGQTSGMIPFVWEQHVIYEVAISSLPRSSAPTSS